MFLCDWHKNVPQRKNQVHEMVVSDLFWENVVRGLLFGECLAFCFCFVRTSLITKKNVCFNFKQKIIINFISEGTHLIAGLGNAR